MRVIGLSDMHGSISHLHRIADDLAGADLVLLAGDITHFGHAAEVAAIVGEIMQYNESVLAMSGE